MIYTDLTYFQVGEYAAKLAFAFFAVVILFRIVLAFRNYIYTGTFGEYEKSLIAQLVEEQTFSIRYALTGYHPGFLMFDGLIFFVISVGAKPFWGVYLIVGFFVLLATTMRSRIAKKQEFTAKLNGTYNE